MAIAENSVVSIEYELTEAGGSDIIDSNKGQAPLDFITGKGHIIPGLEKELVNLEKGESSDIKVDASEAYGEMNPEAVETLPREQFAGLELEKGMQLYGQGENGETVTVTVKDFDDNNVTIDYNHPLAGKNLMFSVTVVDVRDATEDEIATGQVGGGHCDDGSCGCG
jgi:FKBP-type peptidyl-prolyl cis-trans isomerase SlyD